MMHWRLQDVRRGRWARLVSVGLLACMVGLIGCGGGPAPDPDPDPTPVVPDGGTIPAAASGSVATVTSDAEGRATFNQGAIEVSVTASGGAALAGVRVQAAQTEEGVLLVYGADPTATRLPTLTVLPAASAASQGIRLTLPTSNVDGQNAAVSYVHQTENLELTAPVVAETTWGQLEEQVAGLPSTGPRLLMMVPRGAPTEVDDATPTVIRSTPFDGCLLVEYGPEIASASRIWPVIEIAVGVLTLYVAATVTALVLANALAEGRSSASQHFLEVARSSVVPTNGTYLLEGAPGLTGVVGDTLHLTLQRGDTAIRADWSEADTTWRRNNLSFQASGNQMQVTLRRATGDEPVYLVIEADRHTWRIPVRIYTGAANVPAQLVVDGRFLVFESGAPDTQTITLGNAGQGTLQVQARADYDWLQVTVNGNRSVTAKVLWERLPRPATYNNVIRITSNGGNVNINVTAHYAGAEITIH